MADDPKKKPWKVTYYFRVVDGKEILGLSERRVQSACAEWNVARTDFDAVCAELGIEIGTP